MVILRKIMDAFWLSKNITQEKQNIKLTTD